MKLLHTSDLHYGHVWRGIPRLDDQNRVLDEILGLCEAHNVDLLLIAGDVFSNHLHHVSPASMARQLLERLAPHLKRGMGVFLLYGNHDNLPLFQLMGALTAEMAGGAGRWPLVIADRAGVYELPGLPHVVVGLPYVTQRQMLNRTIEAGISTEEQATLLSGQLGQWVQWLYQQAPAGRPALFTTHFVVEGYTLDREEGTAFDSYHRELRLSPNDLPHFTSYNALGHIHLQQQIRGAATPTWYSGAPDRLDLGERAYEPAILLVDVPDQPGGLAQVETVPIRGVTPFVSQDLDGQDAVDQFCEAMAAHDPLGEIRITGIAPSVAGLVRGQIAAAAPRVIVTWPQPAQAGALVSSAWIDPNNPLAVVREYLTEQFKEDSAQRDRLTAAFDQLVAAEDASDAEVLA